MTDQQSGNRSLEGKKAVVTGGASGIGKAACQSLAAHGAYVVVADMNGEAAQSVADEVGGEAWQVDLGDTRPLEDLQLDCDIVVNNAGIQRVAQLQDFDPEEFRLLHRIMLEAPFLLIRAALPHMYDQGFGRIINVSSVHGLIASPYKVAYVSAKHGLEGLSKVVCQEGAPHGVTSVCVNPGYVLTPIVEKQIPDQMKVHNMTEDEVIEKVLLVQQAVKEFVLPADLGELIAFLAGPHGRMATGSNFILDGGWMAH